MVSAPDKLDQKEGHKWRLFIGNLPETVERDELHEKFHLLLKRDEGALRVGAVEVKNKDENRFGFVDIYGEGEGGVRKVIDLMNNTKWKGSLIKVQLAKESFLDKLRRERGEGGPQRNDSSTSSSRPFDPNRRTYVRKPENFDFEIVSSKTANAKNNIPSDEGESEEDEVHEESGIPKFKGLAAFGFTPLPPVDAGSLSAGMKEDKESEQFRIKETNVARVTGNQNDSGTGNNKGEEHVVSEEDKERFARFQRIAGYPVSGDEGQKGGRQAAAWEKPAPKDFRNNVNSTSRIPVHVQQSENSGIPLEVEKPEVKGIVFKKHKQQNSDILRQQSLEQFKQTKAEQRRVIQASLAQNKIKNTFEANQTTSNNDKGVSSGSKKAKLDIFNGGGDDEDAYDEDLSFSVKKQYEGTQGQRLLELRGQWGFDERFKIDERFKEDKGRDDLSTQPLEEEKRKQLEVLNHLLGTNTIPQPEDPKKKKKEKKLEHSVLINRYDPELDSGPSAFENEEEDEDEEGFQNPEESSPKKKKSEKKPKEEVDPSTLRSNEPATYKTVSNLKSLFSSGDEPNNIPSHQSGTGFSLLATFGSYDDSEERRSSQLEEPGSSSDAPRKFWQSNPFKYDSSSDDEDDEEGNKKTKPVKPMTPISTSNAPISSKPKQEFFFRKNDPRFDGLEEFFLKKDEREERVDFSDQRRELKSIVKAKAKNAKRKDEKRTLAIKRAMRKKKKYRKSLIKPTSGSGNAMKIGG